MSNVNLENIPPEYLALCPLDGRYAKVGHQLSPYFSEFGLVRYRVLVEVKWLLRFLKTLDHEDPAEVAFNLGKIDEDAIEQIAANFGGEGMKRVKEIEAVTNHDVKAVELYVAEQLEKLGMKPLQPYVHIGCTSEDITNLAYAMMVTDALRDIWIPAADKLSDKVIALTNRYSDTPMLAHTHGQPATPTTVGKEFGVYAVRFTEAYYYLTEIEPLGKFNGATGNYSAISQAFPARTWSDISRTFVEEDLGLNFNAVTTQIESHDWLCHMLDALRHFNNVLHNFDQDIWLYVSMEYLKQIPVATEVGSSTMPHKINPIRFENSEANTEISNALCHTLSDELSYTRMQRDLTDSSSLRNVGLAFGYSLQAIEQTVAGLAKVAVNEEKIHNDLKDRWEVLGEPIQTMLRKYGMPDAYGQLKELTRGKEVTKEILHNFIESLDFLSAEDRETLLNLTPETYIGEAANLAFDISHNCEVYI